MIPLSISEIVIATEGQLVGREAPLRITSVSTDTRTIEPNSLFCALRGDNFDGHEFLAQAFQKGAFIGLIDEVSWREMSQPKALAKEHSLLIVRDTYRALGMIAKYYRSKFPISLIGITGSAGKTTTKECVAAVLGLSQNVFLGAGNFNNHIGLPLNLLKLAPQHEIAVLEMGASAQGEIQYLCSLANPSIGVITCVHPAHLKGFGSLDGIYKTKLELADYVGARKGTLCVWGDDPKLVSLARSRSPKVVTFGQSSECDYRIGKSVQDGDFLQFELNEKYRFRLRGYGLFNIRNAAAALAVADQFGRDLAQIASEWREFVSVNNRFQVEDLPAPQIRFVKDCYNANPNAFRAAIESLQAVKAKGKKIIVVGDMKELGEEAEKYHQELGELLASQDFDFVVVAGEFAGIVTQALQGRNYKMPTMQCSSNREIADFLKTILSDGDLVMIKGSRAMRLEEVVDILKHEFRTQVIL